MTLQEAAALERNMEAVRARRNERMRQALELVALHREAALRDLAKLDKEESK